MVTETIHITPEGELAAVLEKAAKEPVLLEANGIHYRLSREDIRSPDAPEATLEGNPTSADDPLWNIIGLWQSEEETDIAQHKDRYLADAYAPKPE